MNPPPSKRDELAGLRKRTESQARAHAAAHPVKLMSSQAGQLTHELQVHQVELELQNEELRRTRTALETSQARYFDLYDLAPVGYVTLNAKGLIQEANLTAATLLSVTRTELVRRAFSRFIFKDDQGTFHRYSQQLCTAPAPADARRPLVCEVRLLRAKAEPFWAQLQATVAYDADGERTMNIALSDITAQKQLKLAMQESELRYRTLFAQAGDAIVVFDPTTLALLDFNTVACQRLGYSRPDFALLKLSDIEAQESPAAVRCHVQKILRDGGALFETQHRTHSGAVLDVEVRVTPMVLKGRTLLHCIWRDITELKLAHTRLRQLTVELERRVTERTAEVQRLAAIAQHSHALVGLVTPDWRFFFINDAGVRLLGITAAEVYQQRLFEFLPAEGRKLHLRQVVAGLKQDREWKGELPLQRRDGTSVPVVWSIFPTPAQDAGQPEALAIIAHDITGRRELERHVLEISECERRRIGHDLHDSLGQQLAALNFMSSTLRKRLAKHQPDQALAVAEIERAAQHAITEMRDIARGLHVIQADGVSLRAALQDLVEGVAKRSQLFCRFTCTHTFLLNDRDVASQLYRIAQEAVSNAIRHAQAKGIWIRLRSYARGGVRLDIEDNGRGHPNPAGRAAGMGLKIMQYRAAAIGATFHIARRPRGGTRISCHWQPAGTVPENPRAL